MDSDNFKIINVSSTSISIEIVDPSLFDGQFNLGSYIKIPYKNNDTKFVIGIIENYRIKDTDNGDEETESNQPSFVLEVKLTGTLEIDGSVGTFERGGHGIPLPPNNGIALLSDEELDSIFATRIEANEQFCFSKLTTNDLKVPVNGNKFFNKHFAIVGSTGSGKSHTVAKVLQEAIQSKSSGYKGLNNSHIIIFDIHGEYEQAFPQANILNATNLTLPYWMLNGDELEQLFLDTGDRNNYNQSSVLRKVITENKKKHNSGIDKIHFDSPLNFDIQEVYNCLFNIQTETVNSKASNRYMIVGECGTYKNGDSTKPEDGIELMPQQRIEKYFLQKLQFYSSKSQSVTSGTYADGTLDKFIERIENKLQNSRLEFLFGEKSRDISFEETVKQFIGYENSKESNITIINLGGIPFEVLSITVSLISRILFDFGFFYSKLLSKGQKTETPILLLYEEAHIYVPKSDLLKYRSSKLAIERIAKEGRKYGVTLGIVSQRPSEISETIFSQCNNFISMRLTNPEDQNYVKRLLPDTLGNLTETLPTLQSGEALLIGESITLPSLVKIDRCDPEPKSSDIEYFEIWKEQWKNVDFNKIISLWKK
ncbi:ATP-binding protein [Marivirga atlantica]|uniref:ATP-binding protein n=1 Tax=Marivirga atlantica TaxID=1548457 RepID=A0A937DIL0_9BACT|nr:ATP-binding protein [Marivirga atlantica]MBL0763909.1 ATP-binding protein [Marivirga atlantica]